jgi:hypothetical protein
VKRLARIVLSALLGVAIVGSASADVRKLEAVGTVPINPNGQEKGIPRDSAIDQALREAVTRVAQDFLADRWVDETGGGDPDSLVEPAGPVDEVDPTQEPVEGTEALDLEAVLGKKMVPYTSRFRVIEDRGRRPALFAEDPDVREEYVVIVEVHVDADRVQSKLVNAGLIPAGETSLGRNEMLLEVEGLDEYPAYAAFRDLLVGPLGAERVTPVEMSRGRTLLDVQTTASAVDFLEALLTATPENLEIVPVQASGSRVHVVVSWIPEPSS